MDTLFDERPIQRFWFLEVIARIPTSRMSRCCTPTVVWLVARAGLRKVHNAEEWNELHHLLIMQALGGIRCGPTASWATTWPLCTTGPST